MARFRCFTTGQGQKVVQASVAPPKQPIAHCSAAETQGHTSLSLQVPKFHLALLKSTPGPTKSMAIRQEQTQMEAR